MGPPLLSPRRAGVFTAPAFALAVTLLLASAPLPAQPTAPTPVQLDALRAQSQLTPRTAAATTPLTVNPASREEVRQFYRAIYSASENVPLGWTGNYTASSALAAAGDTSAAFKDAVLLRINFFRALAGVNGGVVLNATFNAKAQQAALMMSANTALQHTGIPT
ncbi:MAG: hypothetical protein NTV51_20105, partial [Verrucomicrobia bacterium]|nr:hypothetical protein [Verrucomicrobiota bacterium]